MADLSRREFLRKTATDAGVAAYLAAAGTRLRANPLGLPIGGSTPEEIAVSVLAQLIAVRRGVRVEAGWVPPRRPAAEAGAAAETAGSDASAQNEPEVAR